METSEEKFNEVEKDLKELCIKHGIKAASFTGNIDNSYIGILSIDNLNFSGCYDAVLNVGRLWQHARTTIRSVMNTFEGVRKL